MTEPSKDFERLRRAPLLRFFIERLYDRLPPGLRQVVRFIITGGVNTAFGYLVYSFGVLVLNWGYRASIYLSYGIGISFSYLMFRTFVFTEGDRGFKSYLRFVPTYIFLLIFNLQALHQLVELHPLIADPKWNKMLAQALITPVCAVLSFIINRLFIFRQKNPG